MARISLLCLAISIVISQTAYAQPSIRLGLGFNNMASIPDGVPSYEAGLAYMAGLESPVSPVASLLLEGVFLANTDKNKMGDVFLLDGPTLTVLQANVGIKLISPLLFVVGVIGYNRTTTTPNEEFGVSSTENNIGAGMGVGLNFRSFFGEARLYHSRAAKFTYWLGIIGMQFP